MIPKLFGPLAERYKDRPGGYTRVLRVEPPTKNEYYSVRKGDKHSKPVPKPQDQAPSAILELVDGPKDIRFAMTARTVARQRSKGHYELDELTSMNVSKVTRFRKDGVEDLEEAIAGLDVKKEGKMKNEGEGGRVRN